MSKEIEVLFCKIFVLGHFFEEELFAIDEKMIVELL